MDPAKDPGQFGCVVAARVPSSANAAANPVNFNVVTISVDLAMTPDGGSYNVQAQTVSDLCLSSRTMFVYYGLTVVLDDQGDGITFFSAGNWDTSGAYQNFTIRFDPCTPEVTYFYGGMEIYNSTTAGSVIGGVLGDEIDQLLFYHDNLSGSRMDIDNVRIERAPGNCPTTCGANGIQDWVEQCEIPSEGGDDNCPGRCVPPGETGPNGEPECTCVISCPDPCNACELENDVEVSEISTGAWFTFVASAPAYAFDACGTESSVDSRLSVWTGSCDNLTLVSQNESCSGHPNAGANSDPLSPCYHPTGGRESCLCVPTTIGQRYWVWDAGYSEDFLGETLLLHASKRNTCDALWGERGACCRGLTGVCEDDVAEAACNGTYDTFTLRKSCGTPEAGECVAVTGSCCDTLDGICQEGTTQAACQSPNVWTAGGTCSSCFPTLGACCDVSEGVCTENVARLACAEGDTWTAGATCAEVVCESPVIPTVSEWGLVIIALLLLSGAKVFFGRREVPA